MKEVPIHTVILDFGGPIRDSRIALNEAHNQTIESMLGRKLKPSERFDAEDTWKIMGLPGLVKEHSVLPILFVLKKREIETGKKSPLKQLIKRPQDPLKYLNALKERYDISEAEVNEAALAWRKVFNTQLEDKTTAPLANETLRALKYFHKAGIKVAIATNAGEESGRKYLEVQDVDPAYIQGIYGIETAKEKQFLKPHPYLVNAALHKLHYGEERELPDPSNSQSEFNYLKILKEGTVFVGDATDDVQAARASGVYAIALSNGMGRKADLEKAKPDALFENLGDLADHLKKNKGKLRIE